MSIRVLTLTLLTLSITSIANGQEPPCRHEKTHPPALHGLVAHDCAGEVSARLVHKAGGRHGPLLHVVSGGLRADGPWFLLPASFTPFNPQTIDPLFSPYPRMPTGPSDADRPPVSGVPSHANVTRYWATVPSYQVVLPVGANLTDSVNVAYPALPTTSYTWNRWVGDVQGAFGVYTLNRTANAQATFAGVSYTNYGTPPTSLQTSYVWANSLAAPNTGPTGNGINEVILINEFLGGIIAGGLASMLVDPSTGQIIECDVMIDAADVIQGPGGVTPSDPTEWTALRHEIGHFFGLGHTNLHPGIGNFQPGPYASVALATTGSLAGYPGVNAWGPTPSLTTFMTVPQPIPAMTPVITHLGSGYHDSLADTWPLHPDDQAGLARIYPVYIPTADKDPLINVSSRIIGRNVLEFPAAPGAGVFGRNLWASIMSTSLPRSGAISGTARLSATDAHLFPWHATSTHPIGAHGFLGSAPTSVVGNSSNTCTGDFSIDALPAGSFFTSQGGILPLALQLVAEDLSNLSPFISGAPAASGEWMDQTRYSNPLTPVVSNSLLLQNLVGNQAPGGSAFRVVQGSVIAIDGFDLMEFTRPSVGTPVTPSLENYARPLVDIRPRNGRASASVLRIRARSTNGIPVDPTSARIFVNQVDVTSNLLGTNLANFHKVVTNANGTFHLWRISMPKLLAFAGSYPMSHAPGAILIQFVVRHDTTAGGPNPPLFTWGRNDCYL